MKHFKLLLASALTLFVALVVATPALAQTVDTQKGGAGSISVSNPAGGETYGVYKVFEASYAANQGTVTSVIYTFPGTATQLPAPLDTVFTLDAQTRVVTRIAGKSDMEVTDAVKAYVNANKATLEQATVVSDGTKPLTFTGLPYGYYLVTSTQGNAVVSIDSNLPDVTVRDKNDTLPDFLANVKVTSITIGGQNYTVGGNVPQFDTNNEIVIPWATQGTDGSWTSIYANGVEIVINYEATLTRVVKVDGDLGNINTLTVTPKDDTGKNPWDEPFRSRAEIFTYGTAFKKVDDKGNPLAGAKFAVNGLTLTRVAAGVYWVDKYDATSTTLGTEMVSPADGCIYILGLEQGVTLPVVETAAPAGYNKFAGTTNVPAKLIGQEIWETTGIRYFDADGNLVAMQSSTSHQAPVTSNLKELKPEEIRVFNQTGTELPSTGGMGTTIFYVVGSALVVCAGVLLVTKRRVAKTEA